MSEYEPDSTRDDATLTLTRRTLVAGAAIGSMALDPRWIGAQEATPVAVDLDAFRQINLAITGAEDLDDDGLRQLLDLLLADDEMAPALSTLLADHANTTEFDLRRLDFPLVIVLTNILQFWYLGNFRNQPLANRPARVAKLTSYAALPYFTAPAVCKAFGYWATDPGLD